MKKLYFILVCVSLCLSSCKKEAEQPAPIQPPVAPPVEKPVEPPPPVAKPLSVAELKGYVQKGPFVIGTTIVVSELDSNLSQTGKSFSTSIEDDKGAFGLKSLTLLSKYVDLRASGFYFNEVNGMLSMAPLTLSALADVANTASVNVNVLTHLEKDRVQYLMKNEKKTFAAAKKQAQREILAIFSIVKADITDSERLDIAQAGEDNAILLAVSALLQTGRVESQLSELLAKMALDIREDGKLDNTAIQSSLLDNALRMQQGDVRTNVQSRYSALGLNITVGDFEQYINGFIANTSFISTIKIEYTAWYNNMLYPLPYSEFVDVCTMKVEVPPGNKVRVRVTSGGKLEFSTADNTGWKFVSQSNDGTSEIYEYETIRLAPITSCSVSIKPPAGSLPFRFKVEAFENDAAQPLRTFEYTFYSSTATR